MKRLWLLLALLPLALYWTAKPKPVPAKPLDTEQEHQRSIRYVEAAVKALETGKKLKEVMQPADYEQLLHDLQQTDPRYLEHRVLDQDSQLASFVDLHRRFIKTSEERTNLQAMLANAEVLNHVQDNLRLAPGQQPEAENVMLRLLSVDVLKNSLEWRENPLAQDVEQRVKQLILDPSIFDKTFAEDLRRAAYVDRLELFSSLIKTNPALARQLVDEVRPSVYRQHLLDLLNETRSPT